MVTLAKALGGGLPIGAAVAREDLAFGPGDHGSTFGGGPVPCAGALAVLDVIEDEGLLANAAAMGDRLRDGLTHALRGPASTARPAGAGCWSERRSRRRRPRRRSSSRCCAAAS